MTATIMREIAARPVITGLRGSRCDLGGRIVTSANTKIICGTILLLACIASVVYLSTTAVRDLTALGLIGTIAASVLAGTFGLAKLDRQGQLLARVADQVAQVSKQSPGDLESAVERIVERRLTATGQAPLRGQGTDDRR